MHIILASQSPRRKELLAGMGVEFRTIPSNYEEKLDDTRDPAVVAEELALGKAMDVATKFPDAYVIGSDTIVTIDGRQLEKPIDEADARQMLRGLSGRVNYVTTGLAIVNIAQNIRLLEHDTTAVFFNELTDDEIAAYVATGDPMDKAGGYALQKLRGTMISHIEGEEDTVVGLPTHKLRQMFDQCKIEHS
ncbi:MAG: nucleoside triphosphate pyrophosphatase [Patescibacteria group bacterium]|nr:nucleoside triphosphate pyrophosphatase [Patescibacteria group bacterium]